MEKLENCIICNSCDQKSYLKCIDNLVTKEEFNISKCSNCGFVFTSPRPGIEKIGFFYKSDKYYSHATSNKSITSVIYNLIRKFSIKRKLSLLLKESGSNGTLLDYGCGAGLFVEAASKAGWEALGLEPNLDARKVAKEIGIKVEDPSYLSSMEKGSVNVITLWHVLEHLHDIESVIINLKSLLKQEGILVVAVPNIDSWDADKYQENWAAYDAPRHLYHFTPLTIKMLFAKFGMSVVNTYPMKFDSFYVSLLSEKKSILAYFKAFINGLRSNLKAKKSGNYSSLIYIIK